MKTLVLILITTTTSASDWVTTIDNQIYETPMPVQGMSISGCTIHEQDKWVELHTYDPSRDRISKNSFD